MSCKVHGICGGTLRVGRGTFSLISNRRRGVTGYARWIPANLGRRPFQRVRKLLMVNYAQSLDSSDLPQRADK